ncbi:HNH endonuclease signature motif containing protein [Flavobacterium alkalisoli]|nr:HNH endonuclease signature motif containing protein [Flavobacterium alkalisoli]
MKLLILFISLSLSCFAQADTFTVDCTTYYINRCYSHGGNMVKRSYQNKKEFLKLHNLTHTPKGYEIDHIIPLSQGGTDCPDNMQLLTIAEHRKKTACEAKSKSTKTN